MILADEAACWTDQINWQVLLVFLQVIMLAYLVYGFRRVARNQVELAEYLKSQLEKDD